MCWSISQLISLVHGCAVFFGGVVDINSITTLVWAGRLRASGALGLGDCALTPRVSAEPSPSANATVLDLINPT